MDLFDLITTALEIANYHQNKVILEMFFFIFFNSRGCLDFLLVKSRILIFNFEILDSRKVKIESLSCYF